ncbi:Sideroflexin [Diplonema papillatum]|nr:Sideroflexin [Diplonema papillatum]
MSKPFDLERPYYDQSTYAGRVLHFYDVINPLRLFTSDAELDRCKGLLNEFKMGRINAQDPKINKDLWTARSVLGAVCHPDTGDKLNLAFRPASFIPANVPVCAGMLLSSPTVFNSIFWQWVNQSYNAGFNYVNRPIAKDAAEDTDSVNSTLIAYVMATTVSCGTAVGMSQWLKTNASRLKPMTARCMGIAVPYVAVAGSGAFNVAAMRYREAIDGIAVHHPETGEEMGRSCNAAVTALAQCAASRIVLPAPVLLLPPFLMPLVRAALPAVSRSKAGQVFLDISVMCGALSIALPFAIALFPQTGSFPISSLEPELRKIAEASHLDHVTFNKGL